jgi:hypothetical protein
MCKVSSEHLHVSHYKASRRKSGISWLFTYCKEMKKNQEMFSTTASQSWDCKVLPKMLYFGQIIQMWRYYLNNSLMLFCPIIKEIHQWIKVIVNIVAWPVKAGLDFSIYSSDGHFVQQSGTCPWCAQLGMVLITPVKFGWNPTSSWRADKLNADGWTTGRKF